MTKTPYTSPVPPAKRRRITTLSALVPNAVGPVFSKRGFAGADLAVHWPDIVGAGVARHSRPLQLQWPKGGADHGLGATLVVACTGAFALDLQQMTPVIIERLNQRLGWRCIMRLTIKQMPVRPPERAVPRSQPTAQELADASRIAAGIASDTLREAVARLGAAALHRARQRAETPR